MSILAELSFNKLSPSEEQKSFDCQDDDLNDFFHSDAAHYSRELLAVTYTFEKDNDVVSFFSVLNDKISCEQINAEKLPNKLQRKIPNPKRMRSYPAVKVGRLGVNHKYKGEGVGSDVIDVIKHSFTTNNKTGCRFITVDAYNCDPVIKFYEKNGFKFLTDDDEKEETRLMYFDLINFIPLELEAGE